MLRTIGWLAFLTASLPGSASAETCSLYQKWKKAAGQGDCSAFPESSYFEVTPLPAASGTLFARKIPKCKDGTDTGCASIEIKSLDGTRPFYYVDPYDRQGGPPSNNWVIAFEGGGSCGAMRGDNAVAACMNGTQIDTDNYGFNGYNVFSGGTWFDPDYKEMTTRHPKTDIVTGNPIYTIPNRIVGKGILSTSIQNSFARYNRVLVNKSSFDRFMGNTTTTAPYDGDSVQLFYHGRRMISAMLKDLSRSNGAFNVGTRCPSVSEAECQQVEDFTQADRVVVVGESGGAGGIIHNMEFIKQAILNRAPNAKVVFLLASRMIPWLEAEAHWQGGFLGIWDDIYSGSSIVNGNPGTIDAVTSYDSAAYQPGGVVRALLASWGSSTSATDLFLDAGCKAQHGNTDWRCFDEGHVALYHMDEDVFWFQSLLDSVHARSSPLSFVSGADYAATGFADVATAFGGFLFRPPAGVIPNVGGVGFNYTQDKANRVIYTSESMLQQHPGAGALGFYEPSIDCHTTIFSPAFWSDQLTKPGGNTISLDDAFSGWLGLVAVGAGQDRAWIQDAGSTEQLFWSNGIFGGGWTTSSGLCPQ
jgi:hypothetical protein